MKKHIALAILFVFSAACLLAKTKSPDGRLTVDISQQDSKTFLVVKNKQELMRVQLGFTTKDEDFSKGLTLTSAESAGPFIDTYYPVHGKRIEVCTRYMHTHFLFKNGNGQQMEVEVRVFNDGFAFRYLLPDNAKKQLEFTDELTTFMMPAESHRWIQKFITSYEGDFPYQERGGATGAWNYPALFEYNGTFVLLTEANITRQYCTTHLDNSADANQYKVSYPFAYEGNGQGDVHPTWNGKWKSPWRVAIVGQLKDIVESTMVDNVSDNTTMIDRSWIKPGRAAWVYWAYNHGTKDYQVCRQYVDLAVEMGWEYVLFDWEWDQMAGGGKLEDAVAYALSKGIKPWMWYNSGGTHTGVRSTPLDRMLTHENRMKEFEWLKSIGVVGVKVDFFESDKQQMMAYYLDILDDAAKYQMMVNFHGCTLPRGWNRTYPHLMSQEAVYGAEQYNNAPYMTDNGARINCLLPYTRNVVGPMDYTPVAFTHSQHPHRTSFAHELALSVAFESGIQHWADRPEGFRQLPEEAKRHMQTVPVVWDEIRFLTGYPGESFVVARRSGSVWYVAGLNGLNKAQELQFKPDFLPKKTHQMTIFADGADGTKFSISHQKVRPSDRLSFSCLPQGGFLLVIKQLKSAEADEVLDVARRVNDYFTGKWPDPTQDTFVGRKRPSSLWTRGVYYEGLMALYSIDPQPGYIKYVDDWGNYHKWTPRNGTKTTNADDQCCMQTYLDRYAMTGNKQMLDSCRVNMEKQMAEKRVDYWTWIDAIQMAMPAYAKMYGITDNTRYILFARDCYEWTRNVCGGGLWNNKEGLWWRDADFTPPYKENDGNNCYWSRGNGWVVAAYVRTIEEIEKTGGFRKNWAIRAFYEEVKADYKAMMETLLTCQREDGFWNVSLMSPETYGGPETSGTALFLTGMAWGVRNGLLPARKYRSAIDQAWNAIATTAIHRNGFLGYVQGTGKEPKDGQPVTYSSVPDFEDYGTGCVLLGATEYYKLIKK